MKSKHIDETSIRLITIWTRLPTCNRMLIHVNRWKKKCPLNDMKYRSNAIKPEREINQHSTMFVGEIVIWNSLRFVSVDIIRTIINLSISRSLSINLD